MIQDAQVLLAELTTKNANVFYELGLAHAIGKPVVLVSETMSDVPFDLQQLRVITYNQADPKWGDKLTGKVTAALTETTATPVEAVPLIFRTPVQGQGPQQDAAEGRLEALERQVRLLRKDFSPSSLAWPSQPIELEEYLRELLLRGMSDVQAATIAQQTLSGMFSRSTIARSMEKIVNER